MDLRLIHRPLSGAADQEHNFSLNGLDVQNRILGWGVIVTPDIKKRFGKTVAPRVTVVASLALSVPAKTQAVSDRLLRHAYINGFFIDAYDVELRFLRRGDPGKLRCPSCASDDERSCVKGELVSLRASDEHAMSPNGVRWSIRRPDAPTA